MKYKWCIMAICCICFSMTLAIAKPNLFQEKTLSGITIVIDSGHGGKDDGTQYHHIKEDAINLSIAKKLKTTLRKKGATIIMTRTGDYDLASSSASNRKKEDMRNRVERINQSETDLFLSIHLNAYPSPQVHGVQVFYQKQNPDSQNLAKEISKQMEAISSHVMKEKVGDYFILNETNPIGILIECGFLSNPEDREHLIEDRYQQEIASQITSALESYFSVMNF